MRSRFSALLTTLVVTLAACGGLATEESTTSTVEATTTAAPTTTTTAPALSEAMVLSYALEPGASYSYEISIDQHLDLTATGDATALGEEEIPGEMSLDITGTTTLTQSVAAGTEPGTFEVTIHADFSDLSFEGTIDGDPFDTTEIPDLAAIEPVNVTLLVDEQGNLIEGEDDFEDIFGGLGGLESFGDLGMTGTDLGRFIGPPLTDEEVTVGDTWSETIETPLFSEDEVLTTQIDNEVTGTDVVDGLEVLVIETTTTTSAFEFDLAEFLIGFMQAFVPEDATEEDLAELEAIQESLRFFFAVDATTTDLTTWFDPVGGLARRAELAGGANFNMDVNVPDETTGEMVSFGLQVAIDQAVSYRLIDSGSA